jgi:hypothetical protein
MPARNGTRKDPFCLSDIQPSHFLEFSFFDDPFTTIAVEIHSNRSNSPRVLAGPMASKLNEKFLGQKNISAKSPEP